MRSIKFQLRIEYLWALVALVGIFVFVNTHPIRPHDFWWHITIGREILATGKIPTTDIYSYTAAGQPYPSYQMFWLMEILLFELYKLGGPALVIFIHSLMISIAYGVILWLCKQVSNSWRIATVGVLFAAALGLNDWNVRPQGITFLLASLFLLAIYQYRRKHRWTWLIVLPLGMLVWVNSHGTFLIGLALVGIWLAQEIGEMLLTPPEGGRLVAIKGILAPGASFIITILVCLVNPRGFGIINYLKTLTGNSVVQNLVTEWAPPTFNSLLGTLFFIGLLVCAIVLALSPRRPNFYQVLTFIIFSLLGLKTSRGSVWFGLVMAPILAEHLSFIVLKLPMANRPSVKPEGSRYLNILFVIVIIAMGVISLPWFKSALPFPQLKAGLVSSETPIEATGVLLEKRPEGQVFNALSFGSYLIWAAQPQYPVFVDSRIELYSVKVWLDYLNISNANGDWESILNSYGVNTLMISPIEQLQLIDALNNSHSWHLIYKDNVALIYIRTQ